MLPTNTALLSILLCGGHSAAPRHLRDSPPPSSAVSRRPFESRASQSESESGVAGEESSSSSSASTSAILSDEVVGEASGAGDADEALRIIAEKAGGSGGVVGVSGCCSIMNAALERGNAELALSVFYAMRSTFDQGLGEDGAYVGRWRWSRPDVRVYSLLVHGLAASLRVSDALSVIDIICQVGVSPGVEVPFGKVVRCPSCMIAVAVAQPQDGIQIVSCAACRYKYELVSGDIISIDSEEISMDVPAWKRGLRFLNLTKQTIPAAVHSVVVQTPSGVARTHRFATETATLPAQAGERVTMALAAPLNVYREVGPLKFSPKAPNFYPGEPMCLTNHKDGRESLLLRAPAKDRNSSLFNPSVLFPLLAVLATGDAASGLIDPSLPQLLSVGAVASLTVGATLNLLVFPQLSRLPQRSVDATAIKQQLLSQYAVLQSRIKDLKEAAEKRARKSRVKRVREGLENSLRGRIELIESYARISSMIEIEVELDSDVLAAEAASNVESVAEQIQQIMEIEKLEEKWRLQAEANDEAERLLSSQPIVTEQD